MISTVSKVLKNGPEADLLLNSCAEVASQGGSYSIDTEWAADNWYSTYTINWPTVEQTGGGHAE